MFLLTIRFTAADGSKRFSSGFSRIKFTNIAPYFTLRFLIILISKGWMKRIDDIIGQNVFRMCCILLSMGRMMDLNFVFNSLSRSHSPSVYIGPHVLFIVTAFIAWYHPYRDKLLISSLWFNDLRNSWKIILLNTYDAKKLGKLNKISLLNAQY